MSEILKNSYDAVLDSANSYFRNSYSQAGILSEGFKSIVLDEGLAGQYVESLTDGCTSANSKAAMKQLMENSMEQILTEQSFTGIMPVHSLACPVIRRLWPRFVLKGAVETKVATSPKVTVPFEKPYVLVADASGKPVKHYIPYSAEYKSSTLADMTKSWREVKVSAAGKVDLWDANAPQSKVSAIKFQPIDTLIIKGIKLSGDTAVRPLNVKADISGNATVTLSVEEQEGTPAVAVTHEYMALVRLDGQKGVAVVAFIAMDGGAKTLAELTLAVHYSTEFNESVVSSGFDVVRQDVDIASGEHINFNLPVEFLQDCKALYQIDGLKTATDTMSNVVAHDLDKRIKGFLRDSFLSQPGSLFNELPTGEKYITTFNIQPAVGFANGPSRWAVELTRRIDHIATRIKNNTYLGQGIFNIVGNPLDINLITNIDWAFKAGQGSVDGVSVDYAVGTYQGAHLYKVISSPLVDQGYIYILFIPSAERELTYAYFPYAFVTEGGYRDPNRAMVPSLMMTKRDAMEAFLPAMGVVQIINNGEDDYDPDRAYLPTKAWVSGTDGSSDGFADTAEVPAGH